MFYCIWTVKWIVMKIKFKIITKISQKNDVLEKKNIFGISVKNTPRNAHQNLHLKFAVDQCY